MGSGETVSKGQFVRGKADAAKKGRKLRKTMQDQGTSLKLSGNTWVPISESINSIVDNISSHHGKKGGTRGLKVADRQLEAKNVTRQ
ncbi:hypothetical protein GOBAR_AA32583 [Gossypium barbadense]|uniref:Uncharacterized protein n=1 Tax=Gossypium barbadense TaxID=3634 RepID=A0A2P5WAK1_GOSBA|nr:hypothetical protein GOBAR_AA32583 [Gossypium barbadense]